MECEPGQIRFLLFTAIVNESAISELKDLGATKVILRKHSDIIEVDLRLPQTVDLEKFEFVNMQAQSINKVIEDFSNMSISEKITLVENLAKEERFWEAHNVLEDIWKNSYGTKKSILHAVIGIIVSQIKVQMNQIDTAEIVYKRSLKELLEGGLPSLAVHFPRDFIYPLEISLSELTKIL